MLRKMIAFAALATALSLVGFGAANAKEVKVEGSSTVANTLMRPHEKMIEKKSGQQINIVSDSSGEGIRKLLAGKADIAMISSTLDAIIAKLNKEKSGSVDGSKLIPHLIGVTEPAWIVHPSNPVEELTVKQISKILSGKIKNWKQLGGRDQKIVIVTEQAGGGVRSVVERQLLEGRSIKGQLHEVDGGTINVMRVVAKERAAFGITMAQMAESSVVEITVNQRVFQPLILVTLGDPSAEMRKVIDAARTVSMF